MGKTKEEVRHQFFLTFSAFGKAYDLFEEFVSKVKQLEKLKPKDGEPTYSVILVVEEIDVESARGTPKEEKVEEVSAQEDYSDFFGEDDHSHDEKPRDKSPIPIRYWRDEKGRKK